MKSRTLEEREEELLGAELIVTKLDVAIKQLHTAIDLFFDDGDPISQFTLISAAHGVLRDVAISRGIKKSFKDSPLISEAERSSYLKAVHAPQNFFKHAKTDPNEKMAFRYKLAPLMLLDAVVLWCALGQEPTYKLRVFLIWVQLEFPDLLCYAPAEEFLSSIRESTVSSEAFLILGRQLLREPESNIKKLLSK